MILPSFAFFMFLLAVCVFVNLLPFSWWKKIVLLGANVLFYASYQPMDLIYLFSVILYSYSMAFLLNEKKSRVLLALAIIPILFGLCFFKYSFLFFDEVNLLSIMIPFKCYFKNFARYCRAKYTYTIIQTAFLRKFLFQA